MMRSWVIAITLAVGLSGLGGSALAGKKPSRAAKPAKIDRDDDCAQARKRGKACKITFEEGDDVEGGVATGSGEQVVGREEVTHSNLIRLRRSFRDLIIRTAEQI
jgi:hypothetical protein